MIWDPSTLARLSAPGFNRAIGAGDEEEPRHVEHQGWKDHPRSITPTHPKDQEPGS